MLRARVTVIVALALSGLLLTASRVDAQTVSGLLVEALTRKAVSGVDVVLVADSTGIHVDSARTDPTGAFYLNAPGAGAFRLEFRKSATEHWAVPGFVLGPAESYERQFTVPAMLLSDFFEFQVTKPAIMLRGRSPVYPPHLRSSGIEGECMAQFVVDVNGKVDVSTFKVLRATEQQFCVAVREALPKMSFVPAELRGEKVRQIVMQPFVFTIAK